VINKGVSVKHALFLLAMGFSFYCFADPHYVQALHPYCFFCKKQDADRYFSDYLNKFKSTVSVDIKKHSSEDEGDMYIYIYVINRSNASNFKLDLSCPSNKTYLPFGFEVNPNPHQISPIDGMSSDPVQNNPTAIVTADNKLSWKLNTRTQRQAMWVYSPAKPIERSYELVIDAEGTNSEEDGKTISGKIKVPSCK